MPEEVQYSHSADIPGLILSTARFAEFRFEPHYHLDCHIALIANGVQRQSFRGESLLLTRGAIQLMPPGEVHDGVAALTVVHASNVSTVARAAEWLRGGNHGQALFPLTGRSGAAR